MNRQVPSYYLIIGRGRMAQHLKLYFEFEGISFLQWHRGLPTDQLPSLITHARKVLLAITDSSIENFVDEHSIPANKAIHFSGTLNTDKAQQLHPLMTFSTELYKHNDYKKIPFISIFGNPTLEELIPELTNPFYQIPKEHIELYHALCVLSGNGTILLWQNIFNDFEEQLGVPKKALMPYLQRVLTNLLSGPGDALTGPWMRSDNTTIEKNKFALRDNEYLPLYEGFHDLYKSRSTK